VLALVFIQVVECVCVVLFTVSQSRYATAVVSLVLLFLTGVVLTYRMRLDEFSLPGFVIIGSHWYCLQYYLNRDPISPGILPVIGFAPRVRLGF